MPIEPVSIAAHRERMIAEQIVGDDDVELLGLAHQLHRAIVGEHVLSSTSAYSAACSAVTSSRHSTPDSITFAFSTEQTLLPRLRASSNATRATRSISQVV